MVLRAGPVSVTTPDFISSEQLIGGAGAAGGIIGAETFGAMVTSSLGLTGNMALIGNAGAKLGLGYVLYRIAQGQTGALKSALWLASVGSTGSIVLDVIQRVWPTAAGLRLRRPVRVGAPLPARVGVLGAPAVRVIG